MLVAISIPIFTSQLRKARLATNQANARAAKAEIVAMILDASTDTSKTTTGTGDTATSTAHVYTYKYTVSSATAATDKTAATDTQTDPAAWTVDTKINSVVLGDKVAKTWTWTIDADGNVKGITCTY